MDGLEFLEMKRLIPTHTSRLKGEGSNHAWTESASHTHTQYSNSIVCMLRALICQKEIISDIFRGISQLTTWLLPRIQG